MNEDELRDNEPKNPFTEDFVRNPFSYAEDKPADPYPMTVEELKAIARHWWEQYLDTSVCCWMFNTTGGHEVDRVDYASRRLQRIEKILGEDASERVYREVEQIFRKRFGDECWQAYQEGSLVFDQNSTEEDRAEAERITGKSSWVCQSRRIEP